MGTAKISVTEHDAHFAELAKAFKQDHQMFTFAKVREWYNKHYVTVDEKSIHRYVRDIASLLVHYMERNGLLTLNQFHNMMRKYDCDWDKQFVPKFHDLWEEHSDRYNYRVIAEICNKLIWTEVDKIPGFVRDEK